MWKPQVVGLSRHHQVLTPRLPGVGEKRVDESFTLARAAESVAEVIAAQTDGRAHVCGVGLGAMVAMRLALDHADRVNKLILAGVEVPAGRVPQAMEGLTTLRRLARRWFGNQGRGENTLVAAWRELGELEPEPGTDAEPPVPRPADPPPEQSVPVDAGGPDEATGDNAADEGRGAGEEGTEDQKGTETTASVVIEPVVMEPVVVRPVVSTDFPTEPDDDKNDTEPGEAADADRGTDVAPADQPDPLDKEDASEVTDVIPDQQPAVEAHDAVSFEDVPAPDRADAVGREEQTEATAGLAATPRTAQLPETATETTAMIDVVDRGAPTPAAPLVSQLTGIAAPTMVMCGSRDRANLPAARRLAEAIPEAVLTVVPQVGHAWNHTHPDLFNEIVLGFLEDTDEFEELFGIMY